MKTPTHPLPRLAIAAACLIPAIHGHAQMMLTLAEVGPDIQMTLSGSIDLSKLGYAGPLIVPDDLAAGGTLQARDVPQAKFIAGYWAPQAGTFDVYQANSLANNNWVPGTFGLINTDVSNLGGGSLDHISMAAITFKGQPVEGIGLFQAVVDPNYQSGATLVPMTAMFRGESFASLGITPGSVTYLLGVYDGSTFTPNGATFVVTAVPEPSWRQWGHI